MKRLTSILLLAVAALSAACGKSDPQAATQVAAKVNADEITVHQINSVMARMPGLKPENAEQAKREVLNKLIDQQVAKQLAVEKKLDRTPTVLQALEASKNEILARAYMEQVASAQSKPTAEEAGRYYADHPELFARRRLYNIEELVVADPAIGAELKDKAAQSRTLAEVADWLKGRGVDYKENHGSRASEQIPLEILPQFDRMKDGEIAAIEVAKGHYEVVRIASSQSVPVDETTAAPRIEQFLYNQRITAAVAADVKNARDKAHIEYMGEFAPVANGDAANAKAVDAAPAAATPAAEAPKHDGDNGVGSAVHALQ